MFLDITVSTGLEGDIEPVEALYNDLNDYLASHINYPGWRKGLYPVRTQAESGVAERSLYVARICGRIAGTVTLNHAPEYCGPVKWHVEAANNEMLYVHTLAVHPDFLRFGVGSRLLYFAEQKANAENFKTIRLDVYEENLPAVKLYEKHGYKYVDTVDLGLSCHGLNWFYLYEKPIGE